MRFEVLQSSCGLDGVSRTAYGIVCTDEFGVRHTFPDLSDKSKEVQGFVDKLNIMSPELSQLEYLIEDFCAFPV